MNLKEKIAYLYNYITLLQDYRNSDVEELANEKLATEIHARKYELLSLISIYNDTNVAGYIMHVQNKHESFCCLNTQGVFRKTKKEYVAIKRMIERPKDSDQYKIQKVYITNTMLNFNDQLCRKIK